MIRKLLIANRGEIAVRIARACAEAGVRSVAVYTDADRHALHVRKADEAYHLGPDSAGGYLNVQRIVNLARETGCDAVHPGYGFLAENPALAERCAAAGLRFVGPPPAVIRTAGDKLAARRAVAAAGVPVVPGSDRPLADGDEAAALAAEVGYPVMLKATAGGGGRGIRLCRDEAELRRAWDRVVSEAAKAFGRSEVYLERCLERPRHIEVQILADAHGQVLHLWERDCSIQRRHQKLIEIAPSPQLDAGQRARVCALAVRAAEALGYVNAGTVEFLLEETGEFHFLEVNPRLQVEHPVTEEITGIDIVQAQLAVAAGERLPWRQEEIVPRGMAMELRINAEDPRNDFLPSFGRITRYFAPGGPGVRTDGAIYTGYVIPPYYDSLCVKLVVWAPDWEALLRRALRALDDMGVHGVRTTIPFHREVLRHPVFRSGRFDTGFVEAHPELTRYSVRRPPRELAAAVAAALAARMGL